jgi:FAD/FMN-containing dehydrogenase
VDHSQLNVSNAPIRQLRSAIRGSVIAPGDPEYDAARTLFYTALDRRPAAITRPVDAADVARVVSFARETGTRLAIRSGGHSIAGHGVVDDGLVLDLSAMRGLEIDPVGRTAWAETGLTAGEYTAAVGANGLATGFGDTPSVGIGGITLAGGVGFLHRGFGLTIDSLLGAEIVTADGERILTDAESHPDLFWAIRGGGGNFGVATRFHFRLHEVDAVMGGMLILPATADVVVSFIRAMQESPDAVSGIVNVMLAPPMPFIPASVHGQPILMSMLVHAGPIDAAERALAPLRSLASPIVDMIRPMRYPQMYETGDPPRPGALAARNCFLDEVDVAVADAVLDHLQRSSAPMRVAQFRVLGGAVARVPIDATAFSHRERGIMGIVAAAYDDVGATAEHQEWATAFADNIRQGEPGAYAAFLGDEGEARVREAYPGSTWERLSRIKERYDPANLFHFNQNITPRDGAGG